MAIFQYCLRLYGHTVGHAGSPICIVHADMTLTQFQVKVKVTRRRPSAPYWCYFLCLFCLLFVFLVFCVQVFFWLLLFYVVSTSAINCLGKTVPEMTYYVSRGTLSNCSLTHCGMSAFFIVFSSSFYSRLPRRLCLSLLACRPIHLHSGNTQLPLMYVWYRNCFMMRDLAQDT